MFRTLLLTSILVLITSSCSHQTLGVEPMGDAFRQQLYAQQVNPGYAAPTPVTGLDGKTADKIFQGYLKNGDGKELGSDSADSLMESK